MKIYDTKTNYSYLLTIYHNTETNRIRILEEKNRRKIIILLLNGRIKYNVRYNRNKCGLILYLYDM